MKTVTIFLTFLYLVQSTSSYYNDDGYVTIEDEEYAIPSPCNGYCEENSFRGKRSGFSVKSRVVDVMMSTKVLPLRPDAPDLFSFLRDQYDLPKGEYLFTRLPRRVLFLFIFLGLCVTGISERYLLKNKEDNYH